MKTKEEILRNHTSGLELFPMTPRDEKEMLMGCIYYAMQQYADSDIEKLPNGNLLDGISEKLYDKRIAYEYSIDNHPEGSKERIEMEAKFNAIYEAEMVVKHISDPQPTNS